MLSYLFTKTPLAFFVMDLWRDEAFSFVMAEQGIADIIKTTAIDFNPPLYYIILHYWMMIFGTSEIALRSLSLLFFCGTLFLMFEIMHQIFKIPYRRALLYFVFLAINPFLLFYAFEARMYSMIVFLITLSYYAFWKKKRNLYIAAITLALYTHYFSVFILCIQALEFGIRNFGTIFSWQNLLSLKKNVRLFDQKLFKDISIFIFPVVLFLPWLIFLFNVHNFHSEDFWIIKPPVHDLLFLPFVLFSGYERVFGEYYHADPGYTNFHRYINTLLIFLGSFPVVAFLASRLWRRFSLSLTISGKSLLSLYFWAFLSPIAIFAMSFFATPLYHPRYFIFAVPGFLLLLIIGFEYILHVLQSILESAKNIRSFQLKIATTFVLTVMLIGYACAVTWEFSILNLKYHYKRDVSSMYQEIMNVKKKGEPIYLSSELDYHLAIYYTRSNEVFIFNKRYDEIPDYVGKILIPEDRITSKKPLFPHRAFIVYYNSFDIYSEM